MTESEETIDASRSSARNWKDSLRQPATVTVAVTAAVFVVFFVYSAIRFPVPGINEPHYLTKAKHFHNPTWCAGDFFLTSSSPHVAFYSTVGLLTRWLPLAAVAWIGRIVAIVLLSVGWTALVRRLSKHAWVPWTSACLFLGLAAVGNFSGEWLVGGVEGKVFSYGWLFLSLAMLIDRRWIAAGACSGLAITFHPVVGVWGILAACLALVIRVSRTRKVSLSFSNVALGIVTCAVCALPGLLPVFELLGETDATTSFRANYIQVTYRLAHHVDPMMFTAFAYIFYALLTAAWLSLRRKTERSTAESFFAMFVLAALLIAGVGILIGLGSRPMETMPWYKVRMSLLRFYPFRLFDVILPMAFAVTLSEWFASRLYQPEAQASGLAGQTRSRQRIAAAFCVVILVAATLAPTVNGRPANLWGRRLDDWYETCDWIARNTPTDAVMLTPEESWAFKWYAERAEYVNLKDCPQDAAGIVEWNRRLRFLQKWTSDNYSNNQYDPDELRALRLRTGITHIVASRLGPIATAPIHENSSFRVYALP